jgi:uncharacterized membrane protein
MKKQIITAIAIVFVVMYLFYSFIYLELDFKCWEQQNRASYIVLSIILSTFSSWAIAMLNQD